MFDINGYYMMSDAKNKETTARLVDFLTGRENLLRWSLGHPPLKEWTVDEAVKHRLYGEAERWWLEEVVTLSSKVPVLRGRRLYCQRRSAEELLPGGS